MPSGVILMFFTPFYI